VEEMSFIWANRSHRGKPEANAITATAAEAIIHALGCFTESRS
jgi:hypothetical protein